MNLEKVKTYEL